MLVDTHFHYEGNVDDFAVNILNGALQANVGLFIMSGYDLSSSEKAVNIASNYDNVYAVVGIHPEVADKYSETDLIKLESLIANNEVVGIGEIGLDYYWNEYNKENQKKLLISQLQLAQKYDLPVLIHNRNASYDLYDILKNFNLKGVIHCFSDNYEYAVKFIELGYYLGIGGVITFKNAHELRDIVSKIPITSILLETDAPYLAPVPYRGKENKPEYLPYIAKKLEK